MYQTLQNTFRDPPVWVQQDTIVSTIHKHPTTDLNQKERSLQQAHGSEDLQFQRKQNRKQKKKPPLCLKIAHHNNSDI
jgi:hypothetical protein